MVKVKPRVPVPKRPPYERIKDFNEVVLGYSEKEALEEASRCLQCPEKPCTSGCPVGIEIPRFIRFIRERMYEEAYKVIKEKCPIPAITGRVCPQEKQCEKTCTLAKFGQPIAIGALERFVADWAREESLEVDKPPKSCSRRKVAIIGSGPAGIVAAYDLSRMGHQVVVFEALHKPGGVLVYGIPEYRLPKKIVEKEIENLKALGVGIETCVFVGKTTSIYNLLEEFDAVFIGTGAGVPKMLGIPGECLGYVYTANEYLTRVNLMKAYLFPEYHTPIHKGKVVAVIGGGNTAMDVARTAIRLGAEKTLVLYRRTKAEMPARADEVVNAEEEGADFMFLVQPIEFIGGSKVEKIKLAKVFVEENNRVKLAPTCEIINLNVDMVVEAVGFYPNASITATTPEIKTDQQGKIIVDACGRTMLSRVYAGGDVVTGAGTVIEAMRWGRLVARTICNDFSG